MLCFRNLKIHLYYFLNKSKNKQVIAHRNKHGLFKGEKDDPDYLATQVPYELLTVDVVGAFAKHLADGATAACDPTKGQLSVNTVDSYISGCKSMFCEYVYQKIKNPDAFEGSWTRIRKKLIDEVAERVVKDGGKLVNGAQAATGQDAHCTGLLCVWNGTVFALEFLLLSNSQKEFGGRVTETARRRLKHLGSREERIGPFDNYLLTMSIARDKTHKETQNTVYPRASIQEWFDDFACILALYFVMRTTMTACSATEDPGEQSMFPTFHEAACNEDAGGPKNNGVAGIWAKAFKSLYDRYKEIEGFFEEKGLTLNGKLKSHSGKKRCAQELANNGASGML